MELKIYNSTGTLKLTANPNSTSTVTREVMGEYAVSAAFTHTDFVQLDVNDYVLVDGVKYKLKTPYKPVKKNTQTFIYQVKFYAPIHDAEDALFLYEADGDTTTEFSYDGGPREHLQLWVDNMNRIAGAVLWSIGTVIAGDNKTIDYRNVYCWEAAFGSNGIAATFETELWADGYVVNLCKASRGEIVELGYQKGLTQLQPEENGEMRFFTRLFPLGSTRNIDPTKYGASRLQLPSREKFVDRNVELYGIKEAWEEDAFKDIYPKYVGSVTSVRSEQLTNKEDREYSVYYFKDSGMTFNPNEYEIPEYTKMLAFQTGDLAGRGNEEGSFEANWHADTLEWEIINLYPDEETQLPGGVIIPQPGDTYIPWNFRMPDEYNTAAEEAYRQAVDNFLVSYSFDPTKYTAPTDRHYIERNAVPLMVGQNVRLLSNEYFTGGYKDTRITKVVQKLNDLCQATLTCTDKIGTGWKTSVDNELSSLQYKLARQAEQAVVDIIKTTDTKTPSDWNVFSALRSKSEFISKKFNDTVIGILTFLQSAIFHAGAIFGKNGYASGMTGFGAKIDENGNAEVESLTSRRYIEAPEFRFNSIEIFLGDKWRAPGGGLIDKVDVESKTCTLKLEDGQIGAVAVGDICMGIFHSLTSSDNATEDTDDSRGNRTFAGFCTVYFTITEVMGDKNEQFKYQIRPVSDSWKFSFDPFEQMKFVAYGSFTREDRQISVYETRTYTRYLWHQNTWEIGKGNIAKQSGDLSNLNVFGLNMEGYSEYTTDVYFTGKIMQVKPDGTPVRTANDRGAWEDLVKEEGKKLCDYYDRVSHDGCLWLCVNEAGTDAEPSADSVDWLLQVDKGTDGTSFNLLGEKGSIEELPSEGNHPNDAWMVDGNLYVWNGSKWVSAGSIQGPAGASISNLGGWYSGLQVPYLGIVRMGWGSWMCRLKEGTQNPPLWIWTDSDGNRLIFAEDGQTFGYLLTGEVNSDEYTLVASDGEQGLEGVPGKDGVPGVDGKDGQDGKTYYTWIRYADTAEGIGMSDDPAGKKYIGLAYNRESPLEGNNPADYLWSLIKGEDGTDGVPGAPGADGKTYYTWIAYSDNADGSGMYQTPTSETRYIGIAVNKETAVESTDPSDYVWSKFRGDDGTGITSVDVEYALSSSRTSAPTSGWNTTAPTVTAGKYLWSRTKVTYTGGQYVYSGTACISGADGQDGADGKDGKGIASVTEQYYLSTSNTSLTGGSWSNTPPSNASGGYVWTRSLITYTDGTSNYTAALCVTGPKGDSLEILGRWYTGLSVPKNGVVTMGPSSYIAKSATTNPPLWTWTDKNGNRLMFKDPGSSTFYYLLTGEENTAQYNDFGSVISRGEDGADGKDGKGIQGITNYYLASSSSSGVTTSTSGWQTAVQTTTATKRYLWNYERITYTDGTTVNTTPAIIGMYAADGTDGTDGRGIRSVREQYGVSSQQGVQPSSWQDTMPTLSATNKYLWNRETTTYTDGSTDTRTHIIAVYGDKGDQGAPGTPGADGKPGQDGKDGLPGCIIRRAEWVAGIEWRNDEALTSGTRYLDVALARDDSTTTGYRAFKCLKTHVSTDSTSPLLSGGATYWEEFGLNATALFTSLIIAKNAHLTFMQGNRLVILNEDGSVAAGFVGSGIPLWVGAEDAETAPFRVTKEGKMHATDAYIEGELKAGKVGDFTIDRGIQNISDNPTAFIDIEKNGGKFFRVNRSNSSGMCSIRADEAVALDIQTYGSSENSVGVDVVANNAGRGYAIRSYGNVLLRARESESIQIHGLRMNVRAVTASGSLKKNDDFVRFSQSGGTALTITVPSASDNVGKVYYLKNTGGTVTLTGSSFLGSDGYTATTSFRLTGTNAYMMVSDGTYWCLFYCG